MNSVIAIRLLYFVPTCIVSGCGIVPATREAHIIQYVTSNTAPDEHPLAVDTSQLPRTWRVERSISQGPRGPLTHISVTGGSCRIVLLPETRPADSQ